MNGEKMKFIDRELQQLKDEGLYKDIKTLEGAQGAWVQIKGEKVLNFCSNNYLGFAADPRIREAAKQAINDFGVGPGAVRPIAGTMTIHNQL